MFERYNNINNTKIKDLLTTTKSYYENLFSSKNIKKNDITNYLNNINLNQKLTPGEANYVKIKYLKKNAKML